MEPPSVDEIMEMNMKRLLEWCEKLKVPNLNSIETANELRQELFKCVKARNKLKPAPPPFSVASSVFQDFGRKQREFACAVDKVEKLITDEAVLLWLKKLHLPEQSVWMTADDLKQVRESCTRGRPILLIAGSTSSGKSTLLNALLGEELLPTSHNAATSVLCEIKYSGSSDKRYAVIHFDNGKEERMDLTNSEEVMRLAGFVNQSREEKFGSIVGLSFNKFEKLVQRQRKCVRVELYWPLEFLKDFILVDSPGVTESEGDSVSRQITERFQEDIACGCIYVLDGMRSAEEAAQAGGLLSAVAKGTHKDPCPDSALFVVNKWDIVSQQQSEEQRQEILHKIASNISFRWKGFRPHQIVTMNSKLAAQAQQLGSSTKDVHRLCQGIARILPRGMDNMLKKAIERPHELMDQIEQSVENTLRELQLPLEERKQKRMEDMDQLKMFKESLKSGNIAKAKQKIGQQIDKMVHELSDCLMSAKGFQDAMKWKKKDLDEAEQEAFSDRNVEDLVTTRFIKAVCRSEPFQGFLKWADEEAKNDAIVISREFNLLKADIAISDPSSPESTDKFEETEEISWDAKKMAAAVAVAIPVLLVGVPLALAVAVVGGPVYGITELVRAARNKSFKNSVENAYKGMIQKVCSREGVLLRQTVLNLLQTHCLPVEVIFKDIPARIHDLEQELTARAKQDAKDVPSYQEVLEQCQEVKGVMSRFILNLNMHNYSGSDIDWPSPKKPIAKGSFGDVYKVTVQGVGVAALKLMQDSITKENADEFLKEFNNSKHFIHPNLVKFHGSVVVSHKPLYLGLLFEWCDGGTLEDVIFSSKRIPPTKQKGFIHVQQLGLEILDGLKFLHSKGIMHRDLKPENIMLTNNKNVRLGDMGLVKPIFLVTGTLCGTMAYMAPEVIRQQPYNTSADMYSIGVILWEMWTGKRVYHDMDCPKALEMLHVNVMKGRAKPGKFLDADRLSDEIPASVIGAWESLVEQCWSIVPRMRPTAEAAYKTVKEMKIL